MALLNEVLLTIKYNRTQAIQQTNRLVTELSNRAKVNVKFNVDNRGALRQVQSTINSLNKNISDKTKIKVNLVPETSKLSSSTNSLFRSIDKQFKNLVYTPISKSFSGIGSLVSRTGTGIIKTVGGVGRTVRSVISDINSSLGNLGGSLTGIFGLLQRIAYATVASMAIFGTYKITQNINDTTKELLENLKEIFVMIGHVDESVMTTIRDVAAKTGVDVKKIIASYQQLISVGYEVQEANDIIRKSTEAAMTTYTEDVNSVVDSVIRTYNIMGKQVGNTEQVLSKMFAAVKFGAFTFGEMAKNLGSILAYGNIAGAKFEEILAAYSIASFSQDASEAATSLRNLFSDVTESMRDELDVLKELQSLGNTWDDMLKKDMLTQKLVFSKYGIVLTNTKGELISFSELMEQVIDKYNKMSDTERMTFIKDLSLKLRSAPAFISLIQNAEKYKDILNEIYSESDKAYQKAIESASKSPTQVLKMINQAFVSSLNIFGEGMLTRFAGLLDNIRIVTQSFVTIMENINKTSKSPSEFFKNSIFMFYQYMKYIISIMPIGVKSVLNFVGTFLMFGIAIKIFKLVTSVIGGFVNFVTKAFLFLTSPVGIVLSLMALLYAGWRYNWLGLRSIIDEISPTITDFFKNLLDRLAEAIMDFNSNEAKTIHRFFERLQEIWKDEDMTLGEKIFATLGTTIKTVLDTLNNATAAFLTFLGVPKERRDEFLKNMNDFTTEIEEYITKIGSAKTATEAFGATIGALRRVIEYPAKLIVESIEASTGIKLTPEFKERLVKGITLGGTFLAGMKLIGRPGGGLALAGAYILITALDEALNNEDYTTLWQKIIGGLKEAIETVESPTYLVAKKLKIGEKFGESTEEEFITALTAALGLAAGAITGNFKTGFTIAAIYLGVKGFLKITEGFDSQSFKNVLEGISKILFSAGLLAMTGLKAINGQYALMISVGLMLLSGLLPQNGQTFEKILSSAIGVLNVYGFTWGKQQKNNAYIAAAMVLALSGVVNNITNVESAIATAIGTVTGLILMSKYGSTLDKSTKAMFVITTVMAVTDIVKNKDLNFEQKIINMLGTAVTIGSQAAILSGSALVGIKVALVVTSINFAISIIQAILDFFSKEKKVRESAKTSFYELFYGNKKPTDVDKQFLQIAQAYAAKVSSEFSTLKNNAKLVTKLSDADVISLMLGVMTFKEPMELAKYISTIYPTSDDFKQVLRANLTDIEQTIGQIFGGTYLANYFNKGLPEIWETLSKIKVSKNTSYQVIQNLSDFITEIGKFYTTMKAFNYKFEGLPSRNNQKITDVINFQNYQKLLQGKQTGGYTADVGEYTVAGVVHGGEWVAPKWMVEHPVYGALISKLEEERKIKRGYRTGGWVNTVPQFRLGTYVPENKKYIVQNVGEFDIPEQITQLPKDQFEKYLDLLDKSIKIQQDLNKTQSELVESGQKQVIVKSIGNIITKSVDATFNTIASLLSKKLGYEVTADLPQNYDVQKEYEKNIKAGLSPFQSLSKEVTSQTLTTMKEFVSGSVELVGEVLSELEKRINFTGIFEIDDSELEKFKKMLEDTEEYQEIMNQKAQMELDALNKTIKETEDTMQKLTDNTTDLLNNLNNQLIGVSTNLYNFNGNIYLLSKIFDSLSESSKQLFKDENTRNAILNTLFSTMINTMTSSFLNLDSSFGLLTNSMYELVGNIFGRNEVVISSLNEAMVKLLLTSEELNYLFDIFIGSLKTLVTLDLLSKLFSVDVTKQNWNVVQETGEKREFKFEFDFNKFTENITKGIEDWSKFFGNVMVQTANGIENTFKFIGDASKNIFDFAVSIAEGSKSINFGQIINNIKNGINDIINNFSKIFGNIGKFFDTLGQTTDKVFKFFSGDEQTLNAMGISKEQYSQMNTEDKLKLAINTVVGDISQLGAVLPTVVGLFSLLAIVLKPILQGFMKVLQPLIDSVLKPINNILIAIGKTIGTLLLPILGPIASVLRLVLTGFAYLVATISWVGDQFTLMINGLLELLPFVNGFLTVQQKREMMKGIPERVNDIMGEPTGTDTGGDTIGSATANEVHNYYNIYIEDNMILSKDDKQLQYLADLIYQYLKPKLSG